MIEISLYIIIIVLLILLLVYILAYKWVSQELEIVKDVDQTEMRRIRQQAQDQYIDYEQHIIKLKHKLQRCQTKRNYYKKRYNALKFKDTVINYDWKEKTLDKIDKLTKNETK